MGVDVDENVAVDIVLQPGEMSLHHVKLVHGSKRNRADQCRIGFVIRYGPTYVRRLISKKDSAVLVRGTDTENNFEHETPPVRDLDEPALKQDAAIMKRYEAVLDRGTGRGIQMGYRGRGLVYRVCCMRL